MPAGTYRLHIVSEEVLCIQVVVLAQPAVHGGVF